MEPVKLLTFGEVAQFFSVTTRTVRNWADKGAIDTVRTPGGHVRVPSSSCAREVKNAERQGNER